MGSEMDSEGAYDLREVSSDVEMHPDDLADVDSDARWVLILLSSNWLSTNIYSRFEEVKDEESKKAQKRPRESDVVDAPSKSDKKSKKRKAEDGKPVAVEADKKKEGGKEEAKEEGKEEGEKKEKKKDKKEKKKAGITPDEKSTLAKQTTASGVIIEDAKIGTGPMAKKGNTVRMRYIGKLTDGKEFDKNTGGKPVCRWGPCLNDWIWPYFSSLSVSERVKLSKVQSSNDLILF